MSSITLDRSIPRSRARAYSDDQWERKKAIFSHLYRYKGKSLRDVQAIFAEEYDFHPTVAMLKTRIRKWDLDRKNKEPDMLYALRIVLERQALGKDTTFLLRGRVVTSNDIKRYFKRKGVVDFQALLRESPAVVATTEVEYHTPETLATMESPERNVPVLAAPDVHCGRITGGNLRATLNPSYINPAFSSTREMNHLDALLYHSRVYCDSIFQTPPRHGSFSGESLARLDLFFNFFLGGHSLLCLNLVPEAFYFFNQAFDQVSLLLTEQHVLFLPYFYSIILPQPIRPREEVMVQLFHFILEKVQLHHPQLLWIHRSVSIINKLSVEDRGEASIRVFQAICDRLWLLDSDGSKLLEIDPTSTFAKLVYHGLCGSYLPGAIFHG